MTLRLRVIIAIISVVMSFMMTGMIKKKKIDLKEALGWYFICLAVLIIDFFPDALRTLSGLLGIATPANMVFMLAIVMLIVVTFLLTAAVSVTSTKVRRLTQEVALLKKELKKEIEQDDKTTHLR